MGKTEIPERNRQAPEVQAPATNPEAERDSLSQGIQDRVDAEATDVLGHPLNYAELAADPDKLGDTVDKLSEAWERLGKVWDKFFALFAPLGLKPSEITASTDRSWHEIDENSDEYKLEDWPEGLDGKKWGKANWSRVEHAARALAEKPDYEKWIKRSSAKWGFSEPFMTSLVEMESGFNAKSRTKKSSAKGLGQAMADSIPTYQKNRYEAFRQEVRASGETAPASAHADLDDPQVAFDFVGYHLAGLVRQANVKVRQEGLPDSYLLSASSDPKWLYMAYNNGGSGYVTLRRYMDNPTPENHDKLTWFQKRQDSYDGVAMEEWQSRSLHAERVGDITRMYEAMQTGVERFVAFDSPPLPVEYARANSGYGVRGKVHADHPEGNHFHNGVDFAAPEGTPIFSVRAGEIVAAVKNDRTSGNYVNVRHEDGSISQYLHLSSIDVSVGSRVSGGTTLGAVGKTGRATGPHLHFIYKDPNGIPRNSEVAVTQAADRKLSTTAATA